MNSLKYISNYLVYALPMVLNLSNVCASEGDRSKFFQSCVKNCKLQNCTDEEDGLNFLVENSLSLPEQWLQWNCLDDCKYQCMWRTTSAYLSRNWDVPQFYGKWPFVRFLGLQEPASVAFSLLNLAAHYYLFNKFRQKVRPDAPLFWTWNLFSLVCMNAWIWSTVFHARDYPVTEIFDYIFAYSMVLSSFYCMLMRLIHRKSKIVQSTVSLSCFIFFVNHFKYLIVGRFDYNYNMKANLITGIAGALGWLLWSAFQWGRRRYVWKCALFVVLGMLSLTLELFDFPPVFWVFDAHSLWHLSSLPLTFLFYSFIIDDCRSLRNEQLAARADLHVEADYDYDEKKKML